MVEIDAGGAEILERTALRITADGIEVRFTAGLPAAGRRILGRAARDLLLHRLPLLAGQGLLAGSWLPADLQAHLVAAEDHAWLQGELPAMGLVAFVADGSVLPRASGVSQQPLRGAVPWHSPPELALEVNLPGAGRVRGAGIPAGITLIVGGGYHGKSTLLRALERGVYPHVPGDGRERVVTRADAWKLRAEDGRRVADLDISAFIGRLPGGVDTRRFTTEAASGSTSMAANLVEALEAGARVLLVDEDTAATNFLIRDARMQALVPRDAEPITPLIDRVRSLHRDLGVSTVMVVGGAGDYLDVADRVIAMEVFRPRDVTAAARAVAARIPARRESEAPEPLPAPPARRIDPASVDPTRHGRHKVRAQHLDALVLGWERVDLTAVEGLVDPAQTRAIGAAVLYCLHRSLFESRPLRDALAAALAAADDQGLEAWAGGEPVGNLARPRLLEMMAALCRLRTLRVRAAAH